MYHALVFWACGTQISAKSFAWYTESPDYKQSCVPRSCFLDLWYTNISKIVFVVHRTHGLQAILCTTPLFFEPLVHKYQQNRLRGTQNPRVSANPVYHALVFGACGTQISAKSSLWYTEPPGFGQSCVPRPCFLGLWYTNISKIACVVHRIPGLQAILCTTLLFFGPVVHKYQQNRLRGTQNPRITSNPVYHAHISANPVYHIPYSWSNALCS